MSEITLDEVTTDVERLAREQLYTDPLTIFPDAVQTRDRVYRLLERGQYPRQINHLYYLASVICALMAETSASVGFSRAAVEQARASGTYAEIIGHNSLRLKSQTMQASLAYWGNRPQRALDIANSTLPWATEPIAQAFLHNGIALFLATTSRPSESRKTLSRAFKAHESARGDSELFDQLGGIFSFSRAKLLQVSAATHLELGDADSAEINALEAVQIYVDGPAELRAIGNEASARIDVGHARLVKGDGEGAQEALSPVLNLPPALRVDWVGFRLKSFQAKMHNHNIATSATGRELSESIENFFETTASDTFPMIDA